MKLQRTKKMNYDPRGVIDARKKVVRIQAFKHQENAGMEERTNAKIISLK